MTYDLMTPTWKEWKLGELLLDCDSLLYHIFGIPRSSLVIVGIKPGALTVKRYGFFATLFWRFIPHA